MPLSGLLRLGVFSVPAFFAAFVSGDALILLQHRGAINCAWYEVPVFLSFSIMMRTIEALSMMRAFLVPTSHGTPTTKDTPIPRTDVG
jgi:hypothetical protein